MTEIFREPLWLLWGALALAALAALWAWSESRRRKILEIFAEATVLAALLPPGIDRARHARAALRSAALGFLFIALAGPRWGIELVESEQVGVHVVLAVDASNSMAAADLKPTRMDRAKLALATLLDELRGNRVGLVAFAGSAAVQCPLTTDTAAARLFLDALRTGMIPDPGTAIGDAIRLGTKMLAPFPGQKGLVLLTDGEDHGSDPLGAAREAAAAGIRVFAVGMGTPEGEPIPETDEQGKVSGYKRDETGQVVLSRLDEKTLAEVARLTQGVYARSTASMGEIAAIAERVKELDRSRLASGARERYKDRTQIPLAAAFLLLLAELLVPPGPRPRAARGGRSGASPSTVTIAQRSGHPPMRGTSALPPKAGGAARRGAALAGILLLAAPALHAGAAQADRALVRGNRHLDRDRFAEAAAEYAKAREADPADLRGSYNEGIARYRQEDFEGAAESFKGAAGGGESAPALPSSAEAGPADAGASPSTSAPEAERSGAAGDGSPLQQDALFNLGDALFRQGKLDDAVQAFRRLVTKDPADDDARHNLQIALAARTQQRKPEEKRQKNEKDKDDKKDQKQGQKQQQGMSQEDARRILEALKEKERGNFKAEEYDRAGQLAKPEKSRGGKDW